MYSVLIVAVLCGSALAVHASSSSDDSFNQLILFGDSYVDTGNVYNLTDGTYPISPPFYQGQYSNGPMWVSLLDVKKKDDHGFGSATTDNNYVVGLTKGNTIPVPGIRQQVDTYLNQTRPKKVKHNRRVHLIWGIGNNFIFSRTATPVGSVNSLMGSVTALLDAGAQTIVVVNAQPAQLYPYTRLSGVPAAYFYQLTVEVNSNITANLTTIKSNYPQANIYLFDANTLITRLIGNATSAKFADTTNPCWIVLNGTTTTPPCPNPNNHVFADTFHLTEPGQQVIANYMQPFFNYPRPNKKTVLPYFTLFQ